MRPVALVVGSLLASFLVPARVTPATAAVLEKPGAYDPLRTTEGEPRVVELTVEDAPRHRELPIRVYLPELASRQPVVLYSHGLGGSRATSEFLGRHWARRGFVAVFLQHPGSDSAVWQGRPPAEARAALVRAASVEQLLARVRDVPAVIDALTAWNAQAGHPLHGRLDLARLGMSGHSFGAITTEAVSGGVTASGKSFRDPRIRAAVVFSPSVPRNADAARAFAQVNLPWLLMTGTRDVSPIGEATAESRRKVFGALPPGHKYELVLDGAEHSVFTDRALPGDRTERNPRHHPAIEAISTAFWDAFLRGDPAAQAWLDGEGPRSVLDAADQWQWK